MSEFSSQPDEQILEYLQNYNLKLISPTDAFVFNLKFITIETEILLIIAIYSQIKNVPWSGRITAPQQSTNCHLMNRKMK